MTREQQLEWEGRMGPLAAAAAGLAALLTIAGPFIQAVAIGAQDDGQRGGLLLIDKNNAEYALVQTVQVLAYVFVAGALAYLLRATIARRPEVLKIATPVVYVAPFLLAVGGVLNLLELISVGDQFAGGPRTEERADDLLAGANPLGSLVSLLGTFCFAVAFVIVSLNAMRAGLLSQFMGILGVIVGALVVLPIPVLAQTQPIVQSFWLGALGALFLGRWPGGRGPAWETGEAMPWPSAAQRHGEAAGKTSAASIPADDPTIEPESKRDDDGAAGDASDPRGEREHPVSKKRKRKRRR